MGIPSQAIRKRVEDRAAGFDLQHLLDRSIFKLSGGEKQRIAFGAACMLRPKLLVLDEPTSNLDHSAIEDLRNMIAKEKAAGTTIVIAEHRLAWIKDLADCFCLFKDGFLACTACRYGLNFLPRRKTGRFQRSQSQAIPDLDGRPEIQKNQDGSISFPAKSPQGRISMMQHQAFPGISPPYNDIHIPRNICCLGDACRNVIEINPCRDAPLECCAKEDYSRSPFTAKLQAFEACSSSIVIYNVLGEGFHFHLFKRSAMAFVWNTFGIEKHPIS